ncbi:hypothetical protein K458DRAFT_137136 [Lentithecium fluviatile CBS 122367]|uniref:Zn(2)-C6 fungal-type domain-containing protein n=1 Tax=Lentithecium fluviatile CBS 122367 TaxID=1168545 RepID=A0A6G1IK15_9PLEO|nr:hypothetical protein K458DRAFT_137136 [Lentithecium fluviatile CBS 122367]
MVYRGKPSAGCGECRKRRTRCDQAIPSCGQCIRTKRLCPGYRNTTDLVIFDQTLQIARKNKTRGRASTSPSSAFTSSPSPSTDPEVVAQRCDARVVQPDGFMYQCILEDLAINHFMNNHVGYDSNSSQFGYLPEYYSHGGFNYTELQQSLKAVGLAGYARLTGRADLLYPATKSYVAAVRSVNNAMSGPNLADREATLMSVMLLSVFEVLIVPRVSGLENLTNHLKGAMSIASIAVKTANLTEIYRKLLGTVVQAVAIAFWTQNEPLPHDFFLLKAEAYFHPYSIHARFVHLIVDLMRFRAGLAGGQFLSPRAACVEAQRLDASLGRFAEGLSRHAPFDKVLVPKPSQEPIYDGSYHVYPANIAAHLWNNLRLSRIQLHQTILDQLSLRSIGLNENDGPASIADQKIESEAIMKRLAAEICASVPQLADYIERLPSYVDRELSDTDNRFTIPKHKPGQPLLSLSLTTATVELSPHFIYDPGPFRKTSLRPCSEDLPRPRPASLYHIYYQLFSLNAIQSLTADMKEWIQERIYWVEEMGDPDDIGLMKAMLHRSLVRVNRRAPDIEGNCVSGQEARSCNAQTNTSIASD